MKSLTSKDVNLKNLTTNYPVQFKAKLSELEKLISTPNIIKEQALSVMRHLETSKNLFAADRRTLDKGIKSLEKIGEGSIKANYEIIYAQLVILATSVLEETLKRYFVNAITQISNLNVSNPRLEKIKISAADLVKSNLKYTTAFAKLILEKEKSEFQNLKKIKDVFNDYLAKEVKLEDKVEKNIIFYTECRHVLVHKGGLIDDDFLRNVSIFKNANIKKYKFSDKIIFDNNDWNVVKSSYTELIVEITKRKT